MATNAKLTYTSESKGFKYEDGDFTLTGNKMITDGKMTSVDGGLVQKAGQYDGNFYIGFTSETPKFSISNVDSADIVTVVTLINALIEALKD